MKKLIRRGLIVFGVIVFALGQSKLSADVIVSWDSRFNLPPQDANGWSILNPSTDSRLIYISDSDGNDSTARTYSPSEVGPDIRNPNISVNAYRTIPAASAQMRDGFPDWILFKKGDSWNYNDRVDGNRGRSLNERTVFTSYGVGTERPLIYTGTMPGIWFYRTQSYGAIIGLHFYAQGRDPNHPEFVGWGNVPSRNGFWIYSDERDGLPATRSILIEDSKFNFYSNNVIQGPDDSLDIIIRRNIITNNYSEIGHSQGMYASYAEIYLEENVFDHNGWYKQSYTTLNDKAEGQATIFNHNTYMSSCFNSIFRKNIFLRSCSIQNKWTANPDGPNDEIKAYNLLADNNFYYGGEIGMSLGGNNDFENGYRWDNVQVHDNVLMNIGWPRPTDRRLAWGIDIIDWQSGLVKGNILSHYGDEENLNNTHGLHISEHQNNLKLEENIVFNLYRRGFFLQEGSQMQNITTIENEIEMPAARYADPDRSLESYMASRGETPTFDAFLNKVLNQSKDNWDIFFTADEINRYFRNGFNVVSNIGNSEPNVIQKRQTEADVDPNRGSVQVKEGDQLTYEAWVLDPDSNGSLSWEWVYTIDGGPEISHSNGNTASMQLPSVDYTIPAGTVGDRIEWTMRVQDTDGAVGEDSVSVAVIDNIRPSANAGSDINVTVPAGQATITVSLDGSGSSDSDGSIVSFRWTGTPDPDDVVQPQLNLPPGAYNFTLEVEDNFGSVNTDSVTVLVNSIGSAERPSIDRFVNRFQPPASVDVPCQSSVRVLKGTQEIRSLECGSNNIATWDGRNSSGDYVATGIYLIVEDGVDVRKVAFLH